jgi:hypothetical protein
MSRTHAPAADRLSSPLATSKPMPMSPRRTSTCVPVRGLRRPSDRSSGGSSRSGKVIGFGTMMWPQHSGHEPPAILRSASPGRGTVRPHFRHRSSMRMLGVVSAAGSIFGLSGEWLMWRLAGATVRMLEATVTRFGLPTVRTLPVKNVQHETWLLSERSFARINRHRIAGVEVKLFQWDRSSSDVDLSAYVR